MKDEITNSDNKDYLEKIAYEQLNESRPGETVYSFVMPQEKLKIPAQTKSFWDTKTWSAWLTNGFNWIKSKF